MLIFNCIGRDGVKVKFLIFNHQQPFEIYADKFVT